MGMYTGVRAKIVLKPEFVDNIRVLMDLDWSSVTNRWGQIAVGDPVLEKWSLVGRADSIPFGGLSYMPDEWEIEVPGKGSRWERLKNDPEWEPRLEDNVWIFQCSLKNYTSEIENFFDNVIPHIAESVQYLEYYYEEWDCGQVYALINGKVQRIGNTKPYPSKSYNDGPGDWTPCLGSESDPMGNSPCLGGDLSQS